MLGTAVGATTHDAALPAALAGALAGVDHSVDYRDDGGHMAVEGTSRPARRLESDVSLITDTGLRPARQRRSTTGPCRPNRGPRHRSTQPRYYVRALRREGRFVGGDTTSKSSAYCTVGRASLLTPACCFVYKHRFCQHRCDRCLPPRHRVASGELNVESPWASPPRRQQRRHPPDYTHPLSTIHIRSRTLR